MHLQSGPIDVSLDVSLGQLVNYVSTWCLTIYSTWTLLQTSLSTERAIGIPTVSAQNESDHGNLLTWA